MKKTTKTLPARTLSTPQLEHVVGGRETRDTKTLDDQDKLDNILIQQLMSKY